MEADGEKTIEVQMKELKFFLRIDILYTIQNFFTTNFPEYTGAAKDKPTFFEPDYGNFPKQAIIIKLNDCLTVFEQLSESTDISLGKSLDDSY
jgi:hypothetical protein